VIAADMKSTSHRFLIAVVVILILLLLPGLFFLYWPTFLTAPCYDLTVTAVTFPAPGKFRIEYEDRLVYGWGVSWEYDIANARGHSRVRNGDCWSFDDKRTLRWPRTSQGLHQQYEDTLEEGPPGTPADEATLRSRILIKPGVYRLYPGETLVFYRGASTNGKPRQGVIVMEPEVQDDQPLEYKPDTPK
jgi:hypothetical protein